jgi:hypothetical protein
VLKVVNQNQGSPFEFCLEQKDRTVNEQNIDLLTDEELVLSFRNLN